MKKKSHLRGGGMGVVGYVKIGIRTGKNERGGEGGEIDVGKK